MSFRLTRAVHIFVLAAVLILAWIAVMAVGVRMLPFLFDPLTPSRTFLTLTRGLAMVAVEAAIVVGWPLGWALGTARWVERGEALTLRALGEPPVRTVLRLAPGGFFFGAALVLISVSGARDATEPGRVVNDLIAETRTACAHANVPTTYAVPLANATWLCLPGEPPRLVGRGPGGLRAVAFSAREAAVTGDLRGIDLQGAMLALTMGKVSARDVTLRGLAPWAGTSSVPPWFRALLLSGATLSLALAAAYCVLRNRLAGRLDAFFLGTIGPLVLLTSWRALEKLDAMRAVFVCAPIAAIVVTLGVGWALSYRV